MTDTYTSYNTEIDNRYHWNDRHFAFIMLQLLCYIVMLAAFQMWLARMHGSETYSGRDDTVGIMCALISIALAGLFVLQECIQMKVASFKNYFSSGWNWIDVGCHSLIAGLTLSWLMASADEPPNRAVSAVGGLLANAKLLS